MEANCKIWVHGHYMLDGYIDDNCDVFILAPGHGGRAAIPISASLFGAIGYTIYPG